MRSKQRPRGDSGGKLQRRISVTSAYRAATTEELPLCEAASGGEPHGSWRFGHGGLTYSVRGQRELTLSMEGSRWTGLWDAAHAMVVAVLVTPAQLGVCWPA